MTRTIALRTFLVAALLGTAGLVAACSSGGPGASTPVAGSAASTSRSGATSTAVGATARATVASTGASIPVNDRPTLVFVDAIW